MTFTRRGILRRAGWFGAAAIGAYCGPGAFLRTLAAASGGAKRNVVFVELDGGNDGLDTIVPHGLFGGLYHSTYRPTLAVPVESLLPIDDVLGFHPGLAALSGLWESGRMAVVQGVGSPLPTFSHDFAKKIWATGDPTGASTTGWFGRHLATLPKTKSLAFDVARAADAMFAGSKQFVPAFPDLGSLKFPIDKKHPDDGWARKQAFVAMHEMLASEEPGIGTLGATGEKLVSVMADLSGLPTISHAAGYPSHAFSEALRLVARLMHSKLGLRYHHVTFEGFDTHAQQDGDSGHARLLETLARGLAAFQQDLGKLGLAKETLIVVYSEFGRAVYENASRGTDHGTAAPVIVIGDSVVGGIHRDHPSLEPAELSAIQEMVPTTDYRDVLGTIASRWLDIDPAPLFPQHAVTDLGFLN